VDAESLVHSTENKNLTDPEEIEKAIKLGEYIKNGEAVSSCSLALTPTLLHAVGCKETLALYSLRKYRHLRRMYPPQTSTSDPP